MNFFSILILSGYPVLLLNIPVIAIIIIIITISITISIIHLLVQY